MDDNWLYRFALTDNGTPLTVNNLGGGFDLDQSRFRKSAQDDKWSFCLTVGTLCPANQERP